MLSALGHTFLDDNSRPITPSGGNLHHIHDVRADDAIDLTGMELIVASDVTSPLVGPNGAAAVFGPQKGASPTDIDQLESGLAQLVSAMAESGWTDAAQLALAPGAGAAGGIGFAALSIGGRVVSGADYFLDLLGFDERVQTVDLVVTGEGRLDSQTLAGKLPAVVARRAAPTPVVAVVGRNDLTGATSVFAQTYAVADLAEADTAGDPVRTATLLRCIGADIGRRDAASAHQSVRLG